MLRLSVLIIVLGSLGCGSALAATSSATIPVTASVPQTCTIGPGTISFGLYDPAGTNASTDLDATGSVTVACTKNATGVTIGLDNGLNPVANQRNMKGASHSDSLQYNVFQDVAHTIGWDNATHKYSLPTTVSKSAQVLTIYGVIPKAQDVSVDTYSDTITAIINY